MAPLRGPMWALSALLILTGCDKLTHSGDTEWARAALERNPNLTIVAADADAKTFTVQVKGSNELHVVRIDEIVGAVPSSGEASKVEEPAAPPVAAEATPPIPADESEPATAKTDEPASSSATAAATGSGELKKSSTGEVLASIGENAPPSDVAKPAEAADKRLLASGPGYSITAGEPRANRTLRLAEATELKSPSNVAVERRYEPIICQGSRRIQIDGRNLEFEGDAVRALEGCEIHISNSHIIAHGLGLQARAAHVHIKNSIIEGDSGSVSASDGAKIYSQQSTFKGLSRRLDTATFTDLGGTRWD